MEEAIAGAMGAMDAFMLGFNARDPQTWAASLNYPHVRFASGGVTVWESAEEFAETRIRDPAPDWLGSFPLVDARCDPGLSRQGTYRYGVSAL